MSLLGSPSLDRGYYQGYFYSLPLNVKRDKNYQTSVRSLSLSSTKNKAVQSVQFSSVSQSCPCNPMNPSMPGLPDHHQLPEFTQIHVHSVSEQSSHLILCHPLLLLPLIPPRIRVFSNESTLCMRWPKYWSFSFSISPSNEDAGLVSIRMNWLDLLAVQGTLKSLLQHHSSKASVLWCSALFIVQLSHPHDHWKNHSLD